MKQPELTPGPRCVVCKKLLSGVRGGALTCSAACRQRKSREAKKRDNRAAEAFVSYAEECSTEALIEQQERNAEVAG